MSLNSVNTNMGAMVALQSLESTQQPACASRRSRFRQAIASPTSTDDGAAYAIAQGIRSTVGALTSANQQLGNVQGLLSTTQAGLNNISNTMASMRDVLVKLSDSSVAGHRPHELSDSSTTRCLRNVKTFIQDANYNGKTLIGNIPRPAVRHVRLWQRVP